MKLVSSRDRTRTTTFRAAAQGHAPEGGGLWVPAQLPAWSDAEALLDLPFGERAATLIERLVGDEFAPGVVRGIVESAFDFPVPLVPVGERIAALELFHGPTLAFKDFGARFLAGVLGESGGRERLVLTATSGDTGAAAAAAFHGRPGARVAVLYPHGRVSPLQERQLACLGDNVRAWAIEGSFDDCQSLARACFADVALGDALGLTSANSINIARLLGQVPYYFEAVARMREHRPGASVAIAVPSGNFGNLCAGLYARAMGLPVAAFVIATNANRTVPDHLDSGRYEPRASVATHSSAMDVGAPSNWERIRLLHDDSLAALREALRWGWRDDQATERALRELRGSGWIGEPHAAVAWSVLREKLGPDEAGVFLATAHPAKFPELLSPLLGLPLDAPPALARLLERPLVRRVLPADREALVRELREFARA